MIENLSREDSTFLIIGGALKFLFTILEKLNTNINRELLNTAMEEMSKRRYLSLDYYIILIVCHVQKMIVSLIRKQRYKLAKTISSEIFGANNSNNDYT